MTDQDKKLPWHDPEQLLNAWTPEHYVAELPPFVNITQVGSMIRVTVRGDSTHHDSPTVTFMVNVWWLNNLAQALDKAHEKFECGFEDRIYKERTGKDRLE